MTSRDGRRRAAFVPGLDRVGLSAATGKPRVCTDKIGRSEESADDSAALPVEQIRPRYDCGRNETSAADHKLHAAMARDPVPVAVRADIMQQVHAGIPMVTVDERV
jgi:hypothetical protein